MCDTFVAWTILPADHIPQKPSHSHEFVLLSNVCVYVEGLSEFSLNVDIQPHCLMFFNYDTDWVARQVLINYSGAQPSPKASDSDLEFTDDVVSLGDSPTAL